MMVDAGRRYTPRANRLAEHAKPPDVGDVEHDDQVGAAKLFDRFGGPIDPGQVVEEESESRRRGRRIGDDDIHPVDSEQVGEPGLAAEPVAVGIYVGGETDPPAGHECRGKGPGGGNTVGREGKRHGAKGNPLPARCRRLLHLRMAAPVQEIDGQPDAPSRRSAAPRCRPGDRTSGSRRPGCPRSARTGRAACGTAAAAWDRYSGARARRRRRSRRRAACRWRPARRGGRSAAGRRTPSPRRR